jgi:hypothetical protein
VIKKGYRYQQTKEHKTKAGQAADGTPSGTGKSTHRARNKIRIKNLRHLKNKSWRAEKDNDNIRDKIKTQTDVQNREKITQPVKKPMQFQIRRLFRVPQQP